MKIPKDYRYLLEASDENLFREAVAELNGYAQAILQERQHQDRVFLMGVRRGDYEDDETARAVRQRVYRRRKMLRKIISNFSNPENSDLAWVLKMMRREGVLV